MTASALDLRIALTDGHHGVTSDVGGSPMPGNAVDFWVRDDLGPLVLGSVGVMDTATIARGEQFTVSFRSKLMEVARFMGGHVSCSAGCGDRCVVSYSNVVTSARHNFTHN